MCPVYLRKSGPLHFATRRFFVVYKYYEQLQNVKDHFRGDTRDTYRGAMRADINRLRLSKELTGGWRTLAALPSPVELNQGKLY